MRTMLVAAAVIIIPSIHASAQGERRATLTVQGTAYDSLHGTPLRAAFVMIAGSSRNATSDGHGHFHFDSLPPGVYTFLLQHASLDSLGLAERATRVTIQRAEDTVHVSVPSFATMWKLECGPGIPPSDSGIVFGTVHSVQRSGPVAGAHVGVSWVDLTVTKDSGVLRQRMGGELRTDSTGAYAACGVPFNLGLRVLATSDSFADVRIEIAPSDARVQRRDFLLGAGAAEHGSIIGVVRDGTGGPVSGARIQIPTLAEARTDRNGRFVIRDVPPGTTQLEVLAIGMVPASAIADVTPRDSAIVDIRVERVAALDTFKVKATAPYNYRVREIADRMKLGDGHYMDSTRIERHADVKSAVSELLGSSCFAVGSLWIDGVQVRDRRDIPYEIRLLKPNEIGLFEWYVRGTPPQFGRTGCTLVVWTKRALPH